MAIRNLLCCFLIVVAPVAGITLGARTTSRKASNTNPIRHINWDPQCQAGASCGGRNNAEIAGIMNMAYIFNFLIALGKEYNATLHITGGVNGADLHLEPRHSPKVSQSWEHYFDVTANDGNPFHDLYEDTNCQEIWATDTDFTKLFQNGETCLTFRERFDHYTNKHAPELMKKHKPAIPFSKDVENAAKLVQNKLPENYGVIHIRRCDRLMSNTNCTVVDTIMERVKRIQREPERWISTKKPVDAWIVFSYAESGYDELLESRLSEVNQKAFFERDISFALNPNKEEDNYFAYWVTQKVMEGASTLLNTHNCKGGKYFYRNLKESRHGKYFFDHSEDSHPHDPVSYSKIMNEHIMESKAVCTWKPGDPAKPMYRNGQ